MHWFLFVALAASCFSASTVIDKHLIDRRFQDISATTVTTLAAFAGLPFLIILYLFHPILPSFYVLKMGFITGWLVLGAYQLYYSALRIAEASLVSTLFQFILPINYVLGLVFFNEKITLLQFLGLVIIVTSATVLAAEEREDKWVVNKKVIGLMILASLCISVSDALFKGVAEHNSYITLAITEYSSTLIAGFLLYAILPNIRKELKNLRGTYKKLSIIAFSNEFFTTVGNFSLRYALLLGPIALVQGMMGAQPFFVLGIAALLALFFPHLRQHKKKTKKRFRTELVAMASVVIGVYLITAQ